jgi:hypothetical protein
MSSGFGTNAILLSSALIWTDSFRFSFLLPTVLSTGTTLHETSQTGNTIAVISGVVSGVVVVVILVVVIVFRQKHNQNEMINVSNSPSDDSPNESLDDTTVETLTHLPESTLFGSISVEMQPDQYSERKHSINPLHDTLCDD